MNPHSAGAAGGLGRRIHQAYSSRARIGIKSEREKARRRRRGARARVCSAAVCRAHSRDLQLMKLGCSRVACQINMSLLPPCLPPRPSPSPKPIPRASSAERELAIPRTCASVCASATPRPVFLPSFLPPARRLVDESSVGLIRNEIASIRSAVRSRQPPRKAFRGNQNLPPFSPAAASSRRRCFLGCLNYALNKF